MYLLTIRIKIPKIQNLKVIFEMISLHNTLYLHIENTLK